MPRPTTTMSDATLLPVIQQWAERHGLALVPRAHDGRVTVTIDGRHRVHLASAADQRVLIEARVADLPDEAAARERLLSDVLAHATARLRDDPAALVGDEHGAALLLQRSVAADGGADALDAAMTAFINSLVFWRHHLAR